MPDLYANVVFGRLTSAANLGDTTLSLDDVSSFPSNDLLSGATFHISFDADLTHPNMFETVPVQSVDTGAKTLTLLTPINVFHPLGTYVKGALTAEMLYLIRTGEAAPNGPPGRNDDVYRFGDRWYDWVGHVHYIYGINGFEPITNSGGGTSTLSPFLLMGA